MAWAFVDGRSKPSLTTPASLWLTLTVSMPLATLLLLLLPSFTTTTISTASAQLLTNGIFPNDYDYDNNNNNYPTKRFATSQLDADCSLCLSGGDAESCRRCLSVDAFLRTAPEDEDEDVLSVSKKWAYEPMRRYQRGSGCSCCYFSRMTNVGCCAACSMTTKRAAGKRSGDDVVMTSAAEGTGAGALLAGVNCRCCEVTGDTECCLRCLAM